MIVTNFKGDPMSRPHKLIFLILGALCALCGKSRVELEIRERVGENDGLHSHVLPTVFPDYRFAIAIPSEPARKAGCLPAVPGRQKQSSSALTPIPPEYLDH